MLSDMRGRFYTWDEPWATVEPMGGGGRHDRQARGGAKQHTARGPRGGAVGVGSGRTGVRVPTSGRRGGGGAGAMAPPLAPEGGAILSFGPTFDVQGKR